MITETQIEKVLDHMEDSELSIADAVADLENKHPHLFSYIVSPQFDEILNSTERDYFHFLVMSVYIIINEYYLTDKDYIISEEEIGAMEESIWSKWEAQGNKDFHSKLDIFFEETEEEDLMALIEDALIETEDDLITEVGREPVFVALKTIKDILLSKK